MDYIVLGLLQARILEWVAVLFSRVSSQLRDQTQVSQIADEAGKPFVVQVEVNLNNCLQSNLEFNLWFIYLPIFISVNKEAGWKEI